MGATQPVLEAASSFDPKPTPMLFYLMVVEEYLLTYLM